MAARYRCARAARTRWKHRPALLWYLTTRSFCVSEFTLSSRLPYAVCVAAALFHLFSTIPVALQIQVSLLRACVNLVRRRYLGELEQGPFDFLIIKESSRGVLVMLLAVGIISCMPRLVWETQGHRLFLAEALSLTALPAANLTFSFCAWAVVRVWLRAGLGVPIPKFEDVRHRQLHPKVCEDEVVTPPRCVVSGDGGTSSGRPARVAASPQRSRRTADGGTSGGSSGGASSGRSARVAASPRRARASSLRRRG